MLAIIRNYAAAASGLAAAGFWWASSLTRGGYFKGSPILLEGGRSLAEFLVKSARLNQIAAFLTGLF